MQNVHHVAPVGNYIGVASTGLDLVALLDPESLEPVRLINSLGKDPWHRFDPGRDYRKINSTKPHESHPNFVFELDGDIWATRFNQKDAICLDDFDKRIDLGGERVHDGHVVGNSILFTSVDGKIIFADRTKLKVSKVIDLNELQDDGLPLGWCRGLLLEGDIAYVAFTRIRQTAIKENVKWLLSKVGRKNNLPTRVVKYNIRTQQKLGERMLPKGVIDAVYSVIRVESPA